LNLDKIDPRKKEKKCKIVKGRKCKRLAKNAEKFAKVGPEIECLRKWVGQLPQLYHSLCLHGVVHK
jgi:hypothetical protein